MKQALLVIDVQNDFCPGGALAVDKANEIIEPVNAVMRDFDAVILTQDWHPANHASFASNHAGAAPFSEVEMSYGPQILWPDHCIQGTKGAEFHPDLDTDAADMILRKGFDPSIDSYSAFFDNDHRTPTGLDGYLKTRAIFDLTVVGLATDFCVNYSVLDARRLGYDVKVRGDLCRAIDLDGSLAKAIEGMRSAGAVIDER
ncbi:bifunctional nicotinamidase/pyrazinamidase [Thioalkalivibrio sp. HK1]|uniref:bifunctional nicotinamidase/pyrazinamidase n=1 Tax=Thioalkalivibrio sp. HK1 TaxID=1469245 RepID=UPI000470E824|nr:bifunctional nicotinamidase/pyrazinamidase [Thioalkalivibrio sp. HK1]